MRIMVTGGAGFIGSHLVERLLGDGHKVKVFDDFSSGRKEHLQNHPALQVVTGDVGDAVGVDEAVRGCDAIYHLAAVASVQASLADPVGTHMTNFVGTLNVVEAAGRHGVERVIYSSSASVYGDALELPVSEDARTKPLSPYAIDKLSGEHYLCCMAGRYGFQGLALRFFNVYGPRQDPSSPYSGVISVFCDRVRAGQGVTVYGDGLQSRDFIYVGDLVDVLARGLEVDIEGAEVFNVGSGEATSLLELLEVLESVEARPIARAHSSQRYGDVRYSQADISKLIEHFRYAPSTSLAEGLARLRSAQAAGAEVGIT